MYPNDPKFSDWQVWANRVNPDQTAPWEAILSGSTSEAHSLIWVYRNDPTFSDRYASANSADPDQTVCRGAVWSGSTLFAIPSASFGLITLWQSHTVQILQWLQQIFLVSEYLGNLRYTFCLSDVVKILLSFQWHKQQPPLKSVDYTSCWSTDAVKIISTLKY